MVYNSMVRRGGYSPIQWGFGKDFAEADRLHDGPDLPLSSFLELLEHRREVPEDRWYGMREKAKTKYKQFMDLEKLSMAMNIKPMAARAYHPGDLIYYKHLQATSSSC